MSRYNVTEMYKYQEKLRRFGGYEKYFITIPMNFM